MNKDFARGERTMRRPDLQQAQQNDIAQPQKTSQQLGRSLPNWANQGYASDIWEEDTTPPPIPERIKTNAWMSRYSSSPKNTSSDQNLSLEKNNAAQSIAAAPQQQQSSQGQQPQKVAQASTQPNGSWLNSSVSAKGGLETIPFNGRIVRTNKEGKQVIIPVKFGQQFQMQPGDQLQYPMVTDSGKQKQLNPQQQRDEAIKKMPYGDKLVDAAKMVPDLLKGDAKAAFKALTTDPVFVAELVGVSAAFAIAQATPAGPFIDAALIAVLGFSGGFSLASYLLKAHSAKDEKGLKASAEELKNLVETVGLAALAGAFRVAGRALGAIKADTSTASVWKAIKGTQPVYKGTLIPRSFELQVGNKKVWVHGNATKHINEMIIGYKRLKGTDKADLFTQFVLEDFRQAASQASKGKIKFGELIQVGRWKFVFGEPPAPGKLPSIYHAEPSGNIDLP
jgi:hypothetical protein